MNNRVKKSVALFCAAMMAAGLATGCGNSSKPALENADKVLFSYDGEDVTLKEAYIYAKMTEANYEQYYSSMMGADFWNMDMGEGSFEDYVKEQVISQIKQVVVLDKKAAEDSISLTEEEVEECKGYAEAFAKEEQGKAILAECGATTEDIEKIYEENKLASKVIDATIQAADTNVSDDEARQTSISRIVFETSKTDEEGNMTEMTTEEKAELKKKAEAALKEIKDGKSLEEVAADQEYTNISETFGAGESEEGADFEKKLAEKKDGDLFETVQECENGYVIAKLVAYTDAEATASKKDSIVSQRQQELFSTTYDEWTKELEEKWDYKNDVDQTLWAEVVFSDTPSTAAESTEVTTESGEAAENSTQAQ